MVDCQLSHCWEFFVFTMSHFGIILPQFASVHSNVGEQAETIGLVAIAPTFAVPSLPRSSIRVGPGHNSPISRNFYWSSQWVSRFCYVCNCATCSRPDIDTGFPDGSILCQRSPNGIGWAVAPTDAHRRIDCRVMLRMMPVSTIVVDDRQRDHNAVLAIIIAIDILTLHECLFHHEDCTFRFCIWFA